MELYDLYELSYGLVLLFYSAATLVLTYNAWRRKNIQPLKFREPRLMIIALISGGIVIGMICFRELDPSQFSCSLYVWISCLFPPSFFVPYFLRCLRLKFIFHWMQSGPLTHTMYKDDTNRDQDYLWYKSRQNWVTSGTLLLVFFIIFSGHIVLAYYIDMSIQTSSGTLGAQIQAAESSNRLGCIFDYEFVPFLLIASFYVISFSVCLISLRKIEDHYGTKKELYLCAVIWIICLTPFFITNLSRDWYWTDEVFPNANWITIMIVLCMSISLVHPLFKTYTPSVNGSPHTFSSQVRSVSEIVSDPHLQQMFENYLIGSLEHSYSLCFSFITRVRDYKTDCEESFSQSNHFDADIRDNVRTNYMAISMKYLEAYGNYELTFLGDIPKGRELISEVIGINHLKSLPGDLSSIFDKISSECVKYLDQNILEGFLKSEPYATYMMAVQRSQSTSRTMTEQGLV